MIDDARPGQHHVGRKITMSMWRINANSKSGDFLHGLRGNEGFRWCVAVITFTTKRIIRWIIINIYRRLLRIRILV